MMKRLISISLVTVVILVGIAITTPYFINSDTIRSKITEHFQNLTGSTVSFEGKPTLSINPFLGVELTSFELSDASQAGTLLSAEKLSAKLKLFSLLQGKLEIAEYNLLRPKLSLKIDSNGTKNWIFNSGKLADTINASSNNEQESASQSNNRLTLGDLNILDGIIEFSNETDKTLETVSSFNGTMSWADTVSPANFSGNGIWRGEGITTSASITDALELLSGRESELSLEINSQPIAFTFSGLANTQASLFVKGELNANTPSINRLASFFKISNEPSNIVESWNLSGDLEATINNISLANAVLAIGENEASGVLRLAKNDLEKYKLDGTLAFDAINLTEIISSESEIKDTDLSIFPLSDLDIDLRVSSPEITLGDTSFEAIAASLLVDEKSWTLDIGNANAFEGTLVAKFGERLDEGKRQAYVDLSATSVDLSTINQVFQNQYVSLSSQSSFTLSVRTNTLSDGLFSAGLNGAFEGDLETGQINGVDLLSLLASQNGQQAISENNYSENAITEFEAASFKVFLSNGIAAISKAEFQTAEKRIQMIGDANLINGELDLQIQEKTETGPSEKRLYVKGTLKAPDISLKQTPNLNN